MSVEFDLLFAAKVLVQNIITTYCTKNDDYRWPKTWLNSVQSNEPYDLVRYVFFQPYQSARLVHFAKGVITIKPTSNYYMKIQHR